MNELKGKSVLVTGSSKGVGESIALKMSTYQMKIGIIGRSEARLQKVSEEIKKNGSEPLILACDLKNQSEIERSIKNLTDAFGTPNYLINNAGIGRRDFWSNITLEEELELINVNFIASVILIRNILSQMLALGRGHVININSIAGMYSTPYQSAYCSSKSALLSYSESLAFELRTQKVKISTICPGPINTDFLLGENYEGFSKAKDIVTPEYIAEKVISVITNPKETVYIGKAWKLWAIRLAKCFPTFFRPIVEKKNNPPKVK